MVWFLAGLTCTEENFTVKAGAQRVAAELGLILVAPDTSPRGEGVPDDPDGAYDFGLGAGFYLDATSRPGRALPHGELLMQELPDIVAELRAGGHGAAGDHGPFDGRPWRADPGAAPSRAVSRRSRRSRRSPRR